MGVRRTWPHSTFNTQHSTFPGSRASRMRLIPRVFSRISLRLMLFNALLVFLPVAGFLLLDSGAPQGPQLEESESAAGPRGNWLYRLGAAILRRPLGRLRALRPLPSSDAYEASAILRGKEVQDALLGRGSVEKRVSSEPGRPVTLYTSAPVYRRGEVIDVVLVSRTTDDIRQDLHAIRLAVLQ